MNYANQSPKLSDLVGLTLVRVEKVLEDEILFEARDGQRFRLHHNQNCCESVYIESVVGDLQDLVGAPILQAMESSSRDRPASLPPRTYEPESETWTFYKFATIKGYVDIRWVGNSNGYYSESVNFDRMPSNERVEMPQNISTTLGLPLD